MPRLRPVQDCRQHPDGICECYRASPQAIQSMEELDYLRSACAAAQVFKCYWVEVILHKHPEALQDDGHRGRRAELSVGSAGMPADRFTCWPSGSTGYSPLHYAARGGHGAAVDLLLRQGEGLRSHTSSAWGGCSSRHGGLCIQVPL